MPIDETEPKGSILKKELEVSLAKIIFLEKENQELRQEVGRLRAHVNTLRAHDLERKSMLWKKLQNSMDAKVPDRSQQKPIFPIVPEQNSVTEKLDPKEDSLKSVAKEERAAKSPKPPQRPSPCHKEANGNKLPSTPMASPPPPPPLPSKLLSISNAHRRMPEVMEFYRSLMKKDAQKESRASSTGNLPVLNPRNMIGEIENRSTYLLNVSIYRTTTIIKWLLVTC
jgi:hypothetical protein